MSDLSRVLGDLYGEGADDRHPEPTTTAQARFRAATAPEWADESRLDEAFAGWTPGPPADAHATEREMSIVIDAPVVPPARLDEDLAATLSAALVDAGHDNHDPEVPYASAPSYTLPDMDEAATFDLGLGVAPAPAPAQSVAPAYEPEPVYEPEPMWEPEPAALVPTRPWSRTDDDIIPAKGAKTPKASKAKGPKAPKAPKAKAPKAPRGRTSRKGDVEAAPAPEAPKASRFKSALTKEKAPKEPKAEKAEKAPSDGPKKFFGIELTFRRSK